MTSRPEPESQPDEIRLVTVFVTGKLIEFEMARDVLNQSGIPFQTQEERSMGLKLAMPVAPTPGPGTFWSLLVPEKAVADANRALAELPFPITTTPGSWDFLPPAATAATRADVRVQRWILSIAFLSLSVAIIMIGIVTLASGRDRDRTEGLTMIISGAVMLAIIVAIIWSSWRWLEKHPENGDHRSPEHDPSDPAGGVRRTPRWGASSRRGNRR